MTLPDESTPLSQGDQLTGLKVYVQTWGCQMNIADSERMMALLGHSGYSPTLEPGEADLLILNTCNIREKARHKVLSRLGELKAFKDLRPHIVIAVSGCVAQAEAEELIKQSPCIDLVFGPDQIERLPQMIAQITSTRSGPFREVPVAPTVCTEFDSETNWSIPIDEVSPWLDEESSECSRYVNIIKGCNNFCTYCVVPYTRGREKSRPQEEILAEARYLAERGVKEIVLLGQNVNSYNLNASAEDISSPFCELLYRVAEIKGIERIRFTTSNPHDFPKDMPKAFRDIPQLCNQFHLPVQSGSNAILKRMNRRYTREQYLERVTALREARPEIALSTDIIVGFPGETEEDFQETLSLISTVKYASLFGFKYSPRRGTPAARFTDQIEQSEKDRRINMLLDLQKEETERQNNLEIGQIRKTLMLYKGKREEGTSYGRTFEGRLVKVYHTDSIIGQIVNVRITAANTAALIGSLI